MSKPVKLKIKKNHPHRCQVPGCHNHGEPCVLDVMDSSAAEFDAVLCEDHIAEAWSCGQ